MSTKIKSVRFDIVKDSDILEFITKYVFNYNEYIKQLIRDDMNKRGFVPTGYIPDKKPVVLNEISVSEEMIERNDVIETNTKVIEAEVENTENEIVEDNIPKVKEKKTAKEFNFPSGLDIVAKKK